MNLDFSSYQTYLPIAVGIVVGLAVMTLVSFRRRPETTSLPPLPLPKEGDWEKIGEESFADRRGTIRREGAPVKIMVSSPAFRNKVDGGYVLDRSTGGLRIALSQAVAPGSSLQVRAENAPDTSPWVTVLVRNCRNAGQHFELGCEFDKPLPWNILLLFG